MRILYSLPHPADRLDAQKAGHVIRANALLGALEKLGNEVIRIEAAAQKNTEVSVKLYRGILRRVLPRSIAIVLRDMARIRHGKKYAQKLIESVYRFKPDVILETHIAFSLAGKIASERTGVKLVLDDCAPAWEEEQQYGVGMKRTARSIHHEVTTHAGLVVAVNDTLRGHLIEEGVLPEKLITIENGIDENYFNPNVNGDIQRKRLGLSDGLVVIVFVGSFQPYHRVDFLLRAFQKINKKLNVHLLLVGEGQTTQEALRLADQLDLMGQVTFTGRIDYKDVPLYIAAGDIAIMPATNEYGNPMKVYEYMAMGKAVVAPNQSTITEIATHGINSYLFEPENIQDMADALEKLAENPTLRMELGREGARLAFENTWEKRGETLLSSINSILG
jgi:glycosyltransferase involved in cell wall biosynthesis